MKYTIVNLVASASLKGYLDLYNLAMSLPNIEYEPEQFPGAILKLKEPKVSMLLFKNGKVICSGASTEKDIVAGIRKASKMIHELQPEIKVRRNIDYEIVNLVATANLRRTLDLFSTALNLDNVEYEPEQFPGAILRLDDPKLTLLLFKNGKVICSGASDEKQIAQAIKKASKLVHEIQPEVPVLRKITYTVVNLVATAALNQTVDLFQAAMSLDNVEYEPEQFPGAIVRIADPKITLLLFKNGKIICAGAKTEALLKKGLNKAAKMIRAINSDKKSKKSGDLV